MQRRGGGGGGKEENKVEGGDEKNYSPPYSVSIHVTFTKCVMHKYEFLSHDLRTIGSKTR
jgi:hypothetical protein